MLAGWFEDLNFIPFFNKDFDIINDIRWFILYIRSSQMQILKGAQRRFSNESKIRRCNTFLLTKCPFPFGH